MAISQEAWWDKISLSKPFAYNPSCSFQKASQNPNQKTLIRKNGKAQKHPKTMSFHVEIDVPTTSKKLVQLSCLSFNLTYGQVISLSSISSTCLPAWEPGRLGGPTALTGPATGRLIPLRRSTLRIMCNKPCTPVTKTDRFLVIY